MRRALTLLLLAYSLKGAVAVVGTPEKASDTTSSTAIATSAASHTAGNCLMVFVRLGSSAATTVTITNVGLDTWTSTGAAVTQASVGQFQAFYAKNINGSAVDVVTATFNTARDYRAIFVYQVSGCSTTAPLDTTEGQPSGTAGSGTTLTTSSFTTGSTDQINICGASVDNLGITFTAGSGYTAQTAPSGFAAAQYRIFTSVQTGITASMTISGAGQSWIIVCAGLVGATSSTFVANPSVFGIAVN